MGMSMPRDLMSTQKTRKPRLMTMSTGNSKPMLLSMGKVSGRSHPEYPVISNMMMVAMLPPAMI